MKESYCWFMGLVFAQVTENATASLSDSIVLCFTSRSQHFLAFHLLANTWSCQHFKLFPSNCTVLCFDTRFPVTYDV